MPRKCVAFYNNKYLTICHRPTCKDCPRIKNILELWEEYPDICKYCGVDESWIIKVTGLINFG